MKTIKITLEVAGNSLEREYSFEDAAERDWTSRIVDMLDTIEKSDVKEF